ncbi:MAG: hypothetical protein KDD41_01775 [Flavobacteriales bacterium]|nr:hypothetical protein [Flavobacteriales bacterium]
MKIKFKHIVTELIIVLAVILVSNYYLKPEKIIIKADGKGYYEYLPAIFIYHDLSWQYLDTLNTPGYYKHSEYVVGAIIGSGSDQHNKYFAGTAILMAPFFAVAHVVAKVFHYKADGYSLPYQQAMWYAALFYLWIGLLYVKRLLLIFNIRRFIIFITQVLLVFATPLLHYVTYEATFSHVYSFVTISAFMYYGLLFISNRKNTHLYLVGFLLGLAFLIRPFNILIAPALLIAFSSFRQVVVFVRYLANKKKMALLITVLIGGLVVGVQCLLWYIQKGSIFFDSYGQETFDFSNPHILSILFSYKKGLFLYSPVLLMGIVVGLYFAFKQKKYLPVFSIAFPILVFTYVLSCWWSWWYGMSYGQRSYIDVLALFAIPIAYGLNQLPRKILYLLLPVYLVTIPVTVIQNFQYKNYILHWDMMNKDTYWETFLKTEDKYRGVLWHEKKTYAKGQVIYNYHVTEKVNVPDGSDWMLLEVNDLPAILDQPFDMVEVSGNITDQDGNAKIIVSIKTEEDQSLYWNQIFTYHQTRGKGSKQEAQFQFTIDRSKLRDARKLHVLLEAREEDANLEKGIIRLVSFDESLNNSSYEDKILEKISVLKADETFMQSLRADSETALNEMLQAEAERLVQRDERKRMLKQEMKASSEWLEKLEEKASQHGHTLEEMMEIDAEYILQTEEDAQKQ